MAYFTPEWAWICVLVLLIGASVLVGLLEAWPLAVLIDSVLTSDPKGDWVHAVSPFDAPGQQARTGGWVVVIAMAAQILAGDKSAVMMFGDSEFRLRPSTLVLMQ